MLNFLGMGRLPNVVINGLRENFSAKKSLTDDFLYPCFRDGCTICWYSRRRRSDNAFLYICFYSECICSSRCKIVFVDIRPDTMNIDVKLIEAAITNVQELLFQCTMQELLVKWI